MEDSLIACERRTAKDREIGEKEGVNGGFSWNQLESAAKKNVFADLFYGISKFFDIQIFSRRSRSGKVSIPREIDMIRESR